MPPPNVNTTRSNALAAAAVVVAPTRKKLDHTVRSEKGGFRETNDEDGSPSEKKARPSAVSTQSPPSNGRDSSPKGLRSMATVGSLMSSGSFSEDAPRKPPTVPIVDRLPFNLVVAGVTFGNILLIALEMEAGPGPGAKLQDRVIWLCAEWVVCCAFVVELIIRINNTKPRRIFFQDLWNVLDSLLVLAACFDASFLALLGMGGQIRFLTVFRALRIVKLVRLVRMFPVFRELWLLVGGLSNSVRALAWVGVVVLIVLYVGSIITTAEIGQADDIYGTGPSYDGEVWPYKEYFGSVFKSMFTLFQVMTLDAWCDDVVRHVVYRQPYMGVLFAIFICLTAFGLMNIVVGIIVENTLAVAKISDSRVEEKKGVARLEAIERLHEVLQKSDATRTGEISMQELKAANQSKIVQELIAKIGLSFEEVVEIFRLLDYEQRGKIEVARFTRACRELVGGVKRRDLAQVEITVGALAQHLENLDQQFTYIEKEIRDVTHMTADFVQNTVRALTGFDGNRKAPPKPRRDNSPSNTG